MFIEIIIPAFLIGLFSAGHCIGMCGGIGAMLSFAAPGKSGAPQLSILFAYNLGRISSYTLMGFIIGTISAAFSSQINGQMPFPFLRIFAAVMMILTGFYISGWWQVLKRLEHLGGFFWRLIHPLSNKIFPVRSLSGAFALGSLWGWLPCGLVYSALALALSFAHPIQSSLSMFAFGLGTMPALFLLGISGNKIKYILQKTSIRAATGIALILFGLWTLYSPVKHLQMPHAQHHHH